MPPCHADECSETVDEVTARHAGEAGADDPYYLEQPRTGETHYFCADCGPLR